MTVKVSGTTRHVQEQMTSHLSAVQPPVKDVTRPLGENVKTLRKEHGWSQGELATRVGADAGQISRYENSKISPSIDVVVKLAEAFDGATDYLLVDGTPAGLSAPTDLLGERLAHLDQLSDDDRTALIHIIDGLLTNTRVRAALTGQASRPSADAPPADSSPPNAVSPPRDPAGSRPAKGTDPAAQRPNR